MATMPSAPASVGFEGAPPAASQPYRNNPAVPLTKVDFPPQCLSSGLLSFEYEKFG